MKSSLFFSRTFDFLELYLNKQRSKSPYTIKAYRDSLTVFRRYLLEQKKFSILKFSFQDCTRDLILDFITYLKMEGKSVTTCNERLAAIKSYLWYVADSDITWQSVAISIGKIPFLKKKKVIKNTIDQNCLKDLFNLPEKTKKGNRDRMILILLYDSAVRVSELTHLNISDVQLTGQNPYIRVEGKGDRQRLVSISSNTVSHIEAYLKNYHTFSEDLNSPFLYTTMKGNRFRMSERNIERIIDKYAKLLREKHPELTAKLHPHMFRRSRATDLYQHSVDLEVVSRFLGHSSTQTTRIYANPSVEQIRAAVEKAANKDIETPVKQNWSSKNEDEIAKLCGLR